jgi:hypothetical protein
VGLPKSLSGKRLGISRSHLQADNGFHVCLDLPGVDPDSVDITEDEAEESAPASGGSWTPVRIVARVRTKEIPCQSCWYSA